MSRRKRWIISFAVLLGALLAAGYYAVLMISPCRTLFRAPHTGGLPFETGGETLETSLRGHVETLAVKIGPRNLHFPQKLEEAVSYIREFWEREGFEVREQPFEYRGAVYRNLWVDIKGSEKPEEIVLLGAHYDSAGSSPGADDNASGVGALLEISRMLRKPGAGKRTLRFAAFPNEEQPFFKSEYSGSRVYARKAAEDGEKIKAMISLESLGYYTEAPGSQKYPPFLGLIFPDKGNFLAVAGNMESRELVKETAVYIRESGEIPCECIAAPARVPGIDWSDHASFWEYGYSAVMATDTVPYRNPHYHQTSDLPGTLDFQAYAKAVRALAYAAYRLAGRD